MRTRSFVHTLSLRRTARTVDSPSVVAYRLSGQPLSILVLLGFPLLIGSCRGAEVELDAEDLFPQVLAINQGDSVCWRTVGTYRITSFGGEFDLALSQANNWSVKNQFNVPGTHYYRRYLGSDLDRASGSRSGMVIALARADRRPMVTINSPVEGFVFNYGPEVRREPIPLLASSDIDSNDIARVEFVSNGAIVANVTDAPYFVPRANLALGQHRLVARLVERSGLVHESDPVHISVQDIQARHLAIEHIKDKNLVLVSWVTPADGQWYSMGRSANVFELKGTDTSSTSENGVRIWVERILPDTMAFLSVRIRH